MPVIQKIAEKQRKTELFHHIVMHTNKWAVGPLDYCGVARIIHGKYETIPNHYHYL